MIVDEELELGDPNEPEELPQEIVEWQTGRGRLIDTPKVSTGWFAAAALGAVAVGAIAFAAVAIGRLAVGRMAVGRARVGRMEIDDLVVGRLTVLED